MMMMMRPVMFCDVCGTISRLYKDFCCISVDDYWHVHSFSLRFFCYWN